MLGNNWRPLGPTRAVRGGWILPNAAAKGYYRWALEEKSFDALLAQGFDTLEPVSSSRWPRDGRERQSQRRGGALEAHAARRAARALTDLGLYDDAASRLYYAAYHLISAALLCLGVQAQTHRGVATLLGQHLVKPGLVPNSVARDFAVLIGLRNQADYNRHFQLDAQGMNEELARVEKLFTSVGDFLESYGISPPKR